MRMRKAYSIVWEPLFSWIHCLLIMFEEFLFGLTTNSFYLQITYNILDLSWISFHSWNSVIYLKVVLYEALQSFNGFQLLTSVNLLVNYRVVSTLVFSVLPNSPWNYSTSVCLWLDSIIVRSHQLAYCNHVFLISDNR